MPAGAWAVAGAGDSQRLAVLPEHAERYDTGEYVLERHDGWVAVASAATD